MSAPSCVYSTVMSEPVGPQVGEETVMLGSGGEGEVKAGTRPRGRVKSFGSRCLREEVR